MTRVAILDDYQGVALQFGRWDTLPAGTDIVRFGDHVSGEQLVTRLAGFPVVVAMRERTAIPRAVLERLPDLRLLVTTGLSNAAIDVAAAAQLGITVCGTGGVVAPTAELTWALILAVVRHVTEEDVSIRAGGWQHTVGGDLAGSTLGVVGLGRLGERVARIGQAFGMEVVAWSQNLSSSRAAEVGAERVDKRDLFERADVITIHLVLSERTTGLIGAEELGAMKPTAVLINTSRGPIIDESALIAALRQRRIAGAGLDVFDQEPLPVDHPMRHLPNTVLTPHLGYVTRNCYSVFYRHIVEDIAAFLAGCPKRVIAGPGETL
jgi:phosphoglycerate dehydrogenase-like enzyme